MTIISKKLASSFKKCDRKQDDFNQCLVTAVQDAIRQLEKPFPEVGLPSLEPIGTSHLTVAPGPKVFQVQQSYKNFNNFGFTTAKISKFEVNFENNIINMEFTVPELRIEYNYEYFGKVLSVPIRGAGPGHVILKDANFIVTFDLEEYQKDDKKFFKVVDSKVILTMKKMTLNLENLVPTDKGTGLGLNNLVDPNKLINDNWQIVYEEVHNGYEKFYAEAFATIFNDLLGNVSISELFGEE
ncbi:JHBP domain containing protein [Asbolus verrucosus]|uniref:JHBP domain containing protein n=1 Tax=Asbolus verrucosus TaxID=1661398 RepID=A0A482W599_ASBVE|nr:JHBP domain containing protein [Asbolus verrucosus]